MTTRPATDTPPTKRRDFRIMRFRVTSLAGFSPFAMNRSAGNKDGGNRKEQKNKIGFHVRLANTDSWFGT
jgi:hypothetical protein